MLPITPRCTDAVHTSSVERFVEAAVRARENALAILLLHDRALRLEVGVDHVEVLHALGFRPQEALEMVRRHHREVVGHVLARARVVEAADVLGERSNCSP
jgi:hypothetical protein